MQSEVRVRAGMTTLAPSRYDFDPVHHIHKIDGIEVPGTSAIFKSLGVIDDRFYNESARMRGQVVHACCHYLAEGDLNWDTVDASVVGYVRGYEKCLLDTGFQPERCETPTPNFNLLYATIPDQEGLIKKDRGVMEFKTGSMMPWTAIQTAFQVMALWPEDYLTKFRIGVELHPDGTYRAQWFDDSNDFNIAQAMVGAYWWKRIYLNGGKTNGK